MEEPEFTKEWVFERGKDFAQRMMDETGHIYLALFAHSADGKVLACPLNDAWGGPTFMRDIAILTVKAEMKKHKSLCYVVLSEAWMVATPVMGKSESMGEAVKRIGKPPSEHPDRIEVVVVAAGDATGMKSGLWRIMRKPSGAFSHLEDIDGLSAGGMMDGRFADLLVDTRKAH